MSLPPAPPPFSSLATQHHALEEAFLQHQEALLGLSLEEAAHRLDAYEAALRRHLEAEEALLLPRFAQLPPVRGAGAELFATEHRKLLEFLGRFRTRLAALSPASPRFKREVLALFDEESTYKHYLHHHERREEVHLFPALDGALSDAERAEVLDAFAQRAGGW